MSILDTVDFGFLKRTVIAFDCDQFAFEPVGITKKHKASAVGLLYAFIKELKRQHE